MIAVVLGASRGLGRAVAAELAARSYDVTLVARNAAALEDAAAAIRVVGGSARTLACDVSDLERFAEGFGRPRLVVNCAAVLGPVRPVLDTAMHEVRSVFEANAVGAFAALRTFLPLLAERGGRFVAVSSSSAAIPTEGLAAYCASKAAFELLHRAAALESSRTTIVLVRPGAVETRMQAALREGTTPLAHSARAAATAGRVRSPGSVAAALIDAALTAAHGETVELAP